MCLLTYIKRSALISCLFSLSALLAATNTNALPKRLQTTSVFAPSRGDLSGAATRLNRLELAELHFDDINQVLRLVPGANSQSEEGYGLFANISLRGVDSGRSAKITLMQDGVLIAPAPYSAPSAYFTPIVGNKAGLEVLKGSSQLQFGPHTTGGVVNYMSTPIPLVESFYFKQVYGKFTVNGSSDSKTQVSYGNSRLLETGARFGYLFELYNRYTSGFKTLDTTDDFTEADDTGLLRYEPMIKLDYSFATYNKNRLELKLGWSDLDGNVSYLGLAPEDFEKDPYKRYTASRFDNMKSEQSANYLKYEHVGDRLSLQSILYYNYFHRNWFKLKGDGSDLIANTDVYSGETNGLWDYRHNNRFYHSYGLDNSGSLKLERVSDKLKLNYGLRLHYDEIFRYQHEEEYATDNEGNITNTIVDEEGSQSHKLARTYALAGVLELEYRMNDLRLKPGLRVEANHYESESYDGPEQRENLSDDSFAETNIVIPLLGLGLTYDLNAATELFAGVYQGVSTPGPAAISGLETERSLSTEMGFRKEKKNKSFEAVAYYTDVDQLIIAESIALGNAISSNIQGLKNYGFELLFASDLLASKASVFSLPLNSSLTWSKAELADGNVPAYNPEWKASINAGLGYDKYKFSVLASWVSKQFSDESNESSSETDANIGVVEAHWSLDGKFAYQLKDHVQTSLFIYNALAFEGPVSYGPIGYRPAAPRQIGASLELRY